MARPPISKLSIEWETNHSPIVLQSLKFTVIHTPASMQHGTGMNFQTGAHFTNKKKKLYTDRIIHESQSYAPKEPWLGPLCLSLSFYLSLPETKPKKGLAWDTRGTDVDNLAKGTIDALTKAKFWKNDSQIVHCILWKWWQEEDLFPRIEIELKQYKP